MSNLKVDPSRTIEDITQAINQTIKKYNDLELDKDLSVEISENTESKEFYLNKKDDIKVKASFEKDSFSLKNLVFEENNSINKEDSQYRFSLDKNNFKEKFDSKINCINNLNYNNNIEDEYKENYKNRIEFIIKANNDYDYSLLNDRKNNNFLKKITNESLELNESTQNLINQNKLNLNLNKFKNIENTNNNINDNLFFNKMNNERHIRNNSENVFENKNKSNNFNNNKNKYAAVNNTSNYNNLLANSNFNSSVDRIYSSLEEFQKNIEKEFTELEGIIDNLIEKDLKLLK